MRTVGLLAGLLVLGVAVPTTTATATATGEETSAAATPTIVVAVNGDDSAPGTLARPLRTIQKAVDKARPGDASPSAAARTR